MTLVNETEIENFKNEIHMNLRGAQNNFIKAYKSGTDGKSRLYLVMEFVKGRTLEDKIVPEGKFNKDVGLIILTCLIFAILAYWQVNYIQS